MCVFQQEDLAYLHQQLFSTATEVVSAGGGEPAMIVTETTTTETNVDMVHDGTYFVVFVLAFGKLGSFIEAFGLALVRCGQLCCYVLWCYILVQCGISENSSDLLLSWLRVDVCV